MKRKSILSFLLVFLLIIVFGKNLNAATQKNILLLIDNSGSMKKNDPEFLIKNVVNNFVTSLDGETQLGIYLFDQTARQIIPLTTLDIQENKDKCIKSLDYINYKGAYTNIPAVMERAVYNLKQVTDSGIYKSIIFLTDGYIDTGDKNKDNESRSWLIESLAADAKKNNIKIFGIAFTENADFQLIQGITTKTDGEYFRVYKANEIENVFNKIMASIETSIKTETIPEAIVITMPPKEDKGIDTWIILIGIGVIIAMLALIIFLTKMKQAGINNPKSTGKNEGKYIPDARLIDLDKVTSEDEIFISNELTTIGRNKENTIWLENATNNVSGLSHAQIIFQDNTFYIKDLSTNYTKLNNVKLKKKELVKLNNEDIISVMKYRFQFILPDSIGQTMISTDTSIVSGSQATIEASVNENNTPKPYNGSESENNKMPEIPKNIFSVKPQPEENEPSETDTEEEPETYVKSGGCPNHHENEPTDVCEVCCKAFCSECLINEGNKTICRFCAK